MLRIDRVAKNADGRPAIDFLEPVKNRTQKRLVLRGIAHVVDGEDHNCIDVGFAHPLGRGELRESETDIKRLCFIEIGEAIGRRTDACERKRKGP
jgi:hypothetical protein